jgi:hypothetical protein
VVLALSLDLLSNLHEPFLVLAQACGLIRIFMTRLISSSESILSVAISWYIGCIPPLHRQRKRHICSLYHEIKLLSKDRHYRCPSA